MVDAIHSGAARSRQFSSNTLVADPARRRAGEELLSRHPGLVDHPLVTPDDQLRLVTAVVEHEKVAIGDLVRAVPDHSAPISAILVLVDAGLLAIDLEVPFDAATQVWRGSPRPGC